MSILASSDSDSWDVLFLSLLESSRLESVRECELVRVLQFETGKQCALIRIDPPMIGQDFGLTEDIYLVLVTPRHEGAELFPVKEFPLFVFICLPAQSAAETDVVAADDVTITGWGELYRAADDAKVRRFG